MSWNFEVHQLYGKIVPLVQRKDDTAEYHLVGVLLVVIVEEEDAPIVVKKKFSSVAEAVDFIRHHWDIATAPFNESIAARVSERTSMLVVRA